MPGTMFLIAVSMTDMPGEAVDGLFGTIVLDEGDLGHAAESVEAFVLSNGLLGDHGAKHNCQRGE